MENLPGTNDEFYIEHRDGTNSFRIRGDLRQAKKEHLMQLILNADRKIARSTNAANIAEAKAIKNRAIENLKEFGKKNMSKSTDLKKLFSSLRRDNESVLFTEEKIDKKNIEKAKKIILRQRQTFCRFIYFIRR